MARAANVPWWVSEDDVICSACHQGYAYHVEVRCSACDGPYCPHCVVREFGVETVICATCAPAPGARAAGNRAVGKGRRRT